MKLDECVIITIPLLLVVSFGCDGGIGSNEQPSSTSLTTLEPTPELTYELTLAPDLTVEPHFAQDLILEPHFQCGPSEPSRGFPQGFLSWTPDASDIVFSESNSVFKVDTDGTQLQKVVDANPDPPSYTGQVFFVYWFHANLSPVSSQLVYTSCQYSTEYEEEDIGQPDTEALMAAGLLDWYERGKIQYEIALSGLDGKFQRRLTFNLKLDHYPSWSPAGDRIAFVSGLENSNNIFIVSSFKMRSDRLGLYTMSPDGSDVRQLASQLRSVALAPPMWSPDGQQLAVVANEGDPLLQDIQTLYVIWSIGSKLIRIGETTAVPATWAPDGEQLAYVGPEGQDIWAARPDGTNVQRIWNSRLGDLPISVHQISWCPDGSEILFVSDSVYVLSLESGGVRQLLKDSAVGTSTKAAWSPDGSEIAVHLPGDRLLTMARDGTDLRILLQIEPNKGMPHMGVALEASSGESQ